MENKKTKKKVERKVDEIRGRHLTMRENVGRIEGAF